MRAVRFLLGALAALSVGASADATPAGRMRMAVANAPGPIMPSQTLVFGRETRAAAGAVIPTYTGSPLTSFSCTGTNSGNFSYASNGSIAPTISGGLQPSYTLNCTASNGVGTSNPVITITTEADTFSVATGAELKTITDNVALVSGKIVKLRPGDYVWPDGGASSASQWFRNRFYTSQLTVTSHDNNNRGRFTLGLFNRLSAPTNLRFYRVNFYSTFTPAMHTGSASGPSLVVTGNVDGFTLEENNHGGNWVDWINTYGFPADNVQYTFRGLIGTDGGTNIVTGGWNVLNNNFYGSWRLLLISTANPATGPVNVVGNYMYDWSMDGIYISGPVNNVKVNWNTIVYPLSLNTDPGHRDGVQFAPNAPFSGMQMIGNRVFGYPAPAFASNPSIDHGTQQLFSEDITPYYVTGARVCGNWGLSSPGGGQGMAFYNYNDSVVCNNTSATFSGWSATTSFDPKARLFKHGASDTPTGSEIADNYSSEPNGTIPVGNVSTNNIQVTPLTNYATHFAGPAFAPTQVLADAETMFTGVGAGQSAVPKVGALGTGYINYATRTADFPRANDVADYTIADITGAPAGTVTTSTPVQITGIVNFSGAPSTQGAFVRLWNGSSSAFRTCSDAACASVITDWTATPSGVGGALIFNGQYLQVRATSSATPSATITTQVRVGFQWEDWSVTTAP